MFMGLFVQLIIRILLIFFIFNSRVLGDNLTKIYIKCSIYNLSIIQLEQPSCKYDTIHFPILIKYCQIIIK